MADAVALQHDMQIAGVADVAADWRLQVAASLGLPVYAAAGDALATMKAAGLPVRGTLDDLLLQVDIIVDCTPKKVAASNVVRYRSAGIRFVL